MDSYSSLAAVERAFQVIDILIGKMEGTSVTEIVNQTGLSKSMVSRILITLKGRGYVEQDERTRFYKLSMGFISIVYRHINALGVEDLVYPLLERIAEKTRELTQLAVVKEDGLYFVAKVEGSNPLKIASMLGRKAPFHATAVGKIWLASLSDEEVLDIVWRSGLKSYTNSTITSPNHLLEELAEIRKYGYSIANEEINEDVIAIGLPIYDSRNASKVIATVVVAVPKFKMSESRIKDIFEICKEEISSFDSSPLVSFNLGFLPSRLKETLNK